MPAYGISLPKATIDALLKIPPPAPVPTLKQSMGNIAALRKYANLENGLYILRLYLEWIPQLEEQYRSLGIPDTIFRDNLTDLTLWAEDYWEKHHAPGFQEWEWVSNTFFLKVFRLARLQFEPSRLEESISVNGKIYPAGTPVLEVHIPAGEPLDAAAVAESLKQAPVFFRTYFRQEFALMRCHSWLLSPQLKNLLPQKSRILQFQNLFTVYGEDLERQAEERVFGYLADDPALYPEETSLQRSLKHALLTGRTVGMGQGIRTIP